MRLLLIDDSDDDALILLRQLRLAGYAVESRRVYSAEALQEALQQPWDLAVCDFRMPGFSGAAALEQVKAQQPELPFIFVSGNLPPGSAGLLSKAAGCVSKDKPAALIDLVRKIL